MLNIYCVIDIFAKYPWVKSMKNKKSKKIIHDFIEIVNESKREPIKLWVDQGRGNLIQKWLVDNDILMSLTHSEDKSVVTEKFTRKKYIKNCS